MAELKQSLDALQKKAKERTVKTQDIEYDLETLVKKIDKNVIRLNPDYQRNHRWHDDFSSKLIESLILNIPIPLIYLSQDVDVDEEADDDVARYSVIDGQQRLTAIHRFFKGKYKLSDLDVLKELNGAYYKDLPPFLVRRLEERTIKCLRIDSTIDGQVKYDIFERLNTGSVKLEAQELRNATCRGPFNELLKVLASDPLYMSLCQLEVDGVRVRKMEDQELVLRFFAISYGDGYKGYKGGFNSFLTAKMQVFNDFEKNELDEMKALFFNTMREISNAFGDEPFAKYRIVDGAHERMSRFNAAVYDAVTYAYSKVAVGERNPISHQDFMNLFRDAEFFSAIEGSVNDVSKLSYRIERLVEALN